MSAPLSPPARLMLVVTLSPALRAEAVEAAVRAGDVAAVVLRQPGENGTAPVDLLRSVAEAIQRHEAAVLIEGGEGLVAAAGLDGVHVSTLAGLEPALRTLKPRAIVGAGGLESRHDAMMAGESGADYVLFGTLAPAAGDFPRTLDFVDWWAELFEVPCVGVATSLDEVEALARAGADFVALAEALTAGPDGAACVAAAQARLIAAGETE